MQQELTELAINRAQEFWSATAGNCTGCKRCTFSCNLLAKHNVTLKELSELGLAILLDCVNGKVDVGKTVGTGVELETDVNIAVIDTATGTEADNGPIISSETDRSLDLAVSAGLEQYPELYDIVRSCYLCGKCSAHCPKHNRAEDVIVAFRQLFVLTNRIDAAASKMTQVDNEWHLFNVYRAVNNIWYNDLLNLDDVQPGQTEHLFFPGCTLCCYAPDLTREIVAWLEDQLGPVALSIECCGSPLSNLGLEERCHQYKLGLVNKMHQAGIKKMITVCPGCGLEFINAMGSDPKFEIVPLPQLLAEAGVTVNIDPEIHPGPYTIFDSCKDRNLFHGSELRKLLDGVELSEMASFGKDTLCCSAGGSVCTFDQEICKAHEQLIYQEFLDSGAKTMISVCPTCDYTFSYPSEELGSRVNPPYAKIHNVNYLDLVFEHGFDWPTIFTSLQDMWTGEYAPWVMEQLL